jgi:hypothetical protein
MINGCKVRSAVIAPFFVECPVLVKTDIESQNFEFPVVNGGLKRNS